MISSKNVNGLPGKDQLRQISKAISVLDAILSPDWKYRYYSYDSSWDEKEEVLEIRNGEADHLLVLFRPEGCCINGYITGTGQPDKKILTKDLPLIFHEFMFGEPVKSIGTTFCLWTDDSGKWQGGGKEDSDKAQEILSIFDGNPSTYCNWAKSYFKKEIPEAIVNQLYHSHPLKRSMVLELNPAFKEWDRLHSDMEEIDYIYEQHQ